MVQNLKLIPTLMERRYVNVNLITVTVRDSTMQKRHLWVMIPIEIAMCSVTTFTKSTVGPLKAKLNYLPI